MIKDTFGMDIEDNLCRLTVQALRYLYKIGKISMEDKDDLIAHMIDSIADGRKSSVETAFQIIFGKSLKNSSEEKISKNLKEFSEQCAIFLEKLRISAASENIIKSKPNLKKSKKNNGPSLLSVSKVPKVSSYYSKGESEEVNYDDVDEEVEDGDDDYEEEEEENEELEEVE